MKRKRTSYLEVDPLMNVREREREREGERERERERDGGREKENTISSSGRV